MEKKMSHTRLNPVPGNNVLPAEIADFYIRVSCVNIISSDRSSSRNGVPVSITYGSVSAGRGK